MVKEANNMKPSMLTSALILALLPLPTLAGPNDIDDLFRGGETVIVDHQPLDSGGLAADTDYLDYFGNPTWQRLADDFVLAAPATISRLRWWGFYHWDDPPSQEEFRVRVYGARPSDGLPDESNIITEESLQNPARTWTGRHVSVTVSPREWLFDVELSSPWSLPANTPLWLEVIQIGDRDTHFRWEFSRADANGQAFINPLTVDWMHTQGITSDTAFQLIGVPEPSTLSVLATGAILVLGKGRRRKEAAPWQTL